MAIPCGLVTVPFIGRLFGVEIFNINGIPFLGTILRDYIHMGTLGFPLLIIIMYIGALNPKNIYVKKLFNIRKELSIISGFPVLTHSLIRVTNNFPDAFKFFVDNEGYMTTIRVTNELGAGITSFSFVLGVLMLIIFIPLWVTSFDSIHKRMGNLKWKKFQKWSYVLYATLFIHAMGIQIGYMLNPRERDLPKKPAIEVATAKTDARSGGNSDTLKLESNDARNVGGSRNAEQVADSRKGQAQTQVERPSGNRRAQSKGFADIEVSPQTKRYIHIISLLLIFGSYLYLRLAKAKKNAAKKRG